MKSIKINLNDQTIYQTNPKTLKEKGFMTSIMSQDKLGKEQAAKVTLTVLHKEGNEESESKADQHILKVGDTITIWGTFGGSTSTE